MSRIDVALKVLEVTGVLLSLLFIGIQFLGRQIGQQKVSEEILLRFAKGITPATLSLLLAAVIAGGAITETLNDSYVFFMLTFLSSALAYISYSAARTAWELESLLKEDLQHSDEKLEVESETTKLEDFNSE